MTRNWEREYVTYAIAFFRQRKSRVTRIQATRTPHGRHYYLDIDPPIDVKKSRTGRNICWETIRSGSITTVPESIRAHWVEQALRNCRKTAQDNLPAIKVAVATSQNQRK